MKLFLSRDEKQVLYKKYCKKYGSTIEANNKLKKITEYLKNLVLKLKKKKKLTQEEIDARFKKEFEKLYQEVEV